MKNTINSIVRENVLFFVKVFFGFCFLWSTSSCEAIENNGNAIKSVTISFDSYYEPLPAAFARLFLWSAPLNIEDLYMASPSGVFEHEIPITPGIDYIFNIRTNNQPVCGIDDDEYVASKRGIRAREVKINEKVLDNSFLFSNHQNTGANFIFRLNQKGEIVPGNGNIITVNDNIPPEIHFINEQIHTLSFPINNKYVNAWFSVVHDTKKGGQSKVEIESLKLFAKLGSGLDVLLASDSYDTEWGGKLYIRYPYFECPLDEAFQWQMPAQIQNSKLVFFPSDITNRVWHGWCTGPWPQVPINAQSLWVEAKIKITGNALMQIGVDIKHNQQTNDGWGEYGVSDWFFSSGDFQYIYFNKPN